MSAYSFMDVNGHLLLLARREGHLPELAGLFTEEELRHDGERFGYASTAAQLRDRLRLHGFTARRAHYELAEAVSAARIWPGTPC
jgi:hypothetical protein